MAKLLIAARSESLSAALAEEPIKITWAMGTGSTAPIDNAMVLEELNKMSRELIGVECDIQYFTEDQLQLSINSGEVFDIYYTCSWYNNTNQAISKGLFLDVAEAVKTVTPGLYASMTQDVWDLATDALREALERKGVEYRISWIPLGGYVMIPDVDPEGTKAIEGGTGNGERGTYPPSEASRRRRCPSRGGNGERGRRRDAPRGAQGRSRSRRDRGPRQDD